MISGSGSANSPVEVLVGVDGVDAVDVERAGDVDVDDPRVRVVGADERRVRGVRLEVVGVAALADEQPVVLAPLDALAEQSRRHAPPSHRRRRPHGAHDPDVAGAAAQLAAERLADLLVGHVAGVAVEARRGHQEARRAEAALQRVVLAGTPAGARDRRAVGLGEALDVRTSRAGGLDREARGTTGRAGRRAGRCSSRRRRARSRRACR